MTDSQLTANEIVRLGQVVAAMKDSGLPDEFIAQLYECARIERPVFDMMTLWEEGAPGEDRDETVAHLQAMLDELQDTSESGSRHAPKIPFEVLEGKVLPSVLAHKRRLRDLIDRHGGVSEVARKAGIPQPSLSRLLNDASRPRRATLFKIAQALDVDESQIVGEYIR